MGRPQELPNRRVIQTYVTGAEMAAIARAAARAKLTVSAWVRARIVAASRRRTGRKKP
jgi:hypothetical protein